MLDDAVYCVYHLITGDFLLYLFSLFINITNGYINYNKIDMFF